MNAKDASSERQAEKPPRTTHLRAYYDALSVLFEREQLLLAEAQARDGVLRGHLGHRFRHSVLASERRPSALNEDFFDDREQLPDPPEMSVESIERTFDFASHLAAGGEWVVEGAPELSFAYVDREIFPARTEGPPETRMAVRWLDLLLVNSDDEDRTPIIGELKIRDDRPTYFAFIQLLMHAAELVSQVQRERLNRQFSKAGFNFPTKGPFLDLYIIAFEPPKGKELRDRSYKATAQISQALLEDERIGAFIRRIAYLNASPADSTLRFIKGFAFPS